MTTLTITGTDLNTNQAQTLTLKASNIFMIISNHAETFNNFCQNFWIDEWELDNNGLNSGNKGINAGAYLHEVLEELTK